MVQVRNLKLPIAFLSHCLSYCHNACGYCQALTQKKRQASSDPLCHTNPAPLFLPPNLFTQAHRPLPPAWNPSPLLASHRSQHSADYLPQRHFRSPPRCSASGPAKVSQLPLAAPRFRKSYRATAFGQSLAGNQPDSTAATIKSPESCKIPFAPVNKKIKLFFRLPTHQKVRITSPRKVLAVGRADRHEFHHPGRWNSGGRVGVASLRRPEVFASAVAPFVHLPVQARRHVVRAQSLRVCRPRMTAHAQLRQLLVCVRFGRPLACSFAPADHMPVRSVSSAALCRERSYSSRRSS